PTAPTDIYPLSLHDALPIYVRLSDAEILHQNVDLATQVIIYDVFSPPVASRIYAYSSLAAYEAIRFSEDSNESIAEKLHGWHTRSEEHTSELQSRENLVCRL